MTCLSFPVYNGSLHFQRDDVGANHCEHLVYNLVLNATMFRLVLEVWKPVEIIWAVFRGSTTVELV